MSWLEAWEKAMLSAAFAEAGEHESALDFQAAGKTAHRKVLLGVSDRNLTPAMLRQAFNICRRIGTGLEILHVLPAFPGAPAAAGRFSRLRERFRARNVFYECVCGHGPPDEEVVRHAAGRRDLILILLGMAGDDGKDAVEPDQHFLARLPCPVVLLRQPQSAG